jgi:DNA repair exonuclease SbcCD nuclease subunit
VVLIVGNHDCLNETSVHHRFSAGSRCRQVTFLDDPNGVSVEVPGTDIIVWGKAMVEHEVAFRPLAGAPRRLQGRWNIIAGRHGLVMDGWEGSRRSTPILTEDLDGIDADYVALGHIHTFGVIRRLPLTAYAGATESSMTGQPGAVVVELRGGRAPTLRWQALPVRSGAA